jgi:hypothetical protein
MLTDGMEKIENYVSFHDISHCFGNLPYGILVILQDPKKVYKS